MCHGEFWRQILAAERKRGTTDSVSAARAAHQPTRERSFAAAQVADEFNNLAAAQLMPEPLAELLGGV